MRPLLIAALLAVGAALVGVVQVVNIPTAQGEVSVNIGVPVPDFFSPSHAAGAGTGSGTVAKATTAAAASRGGATTERVTTGAGKPAVMVVGTADTAKGS